MARSLHENREICETHETRIGSAAVSGTTAETTEVEIEVEVGIGTGTCVGTETEALAERGLVPGIAILTGTAVPRQSLNPRYGLTLAIEALPLQPHHNQHKSHKPVQLLRHVSPRPL